jgi:hypothetical protein
MRQLVRREFLLGMAGGAIALAWPASLLAAPKLEADPQKMYWISPEAGPWVIVCASYGGLNPQEVSRQVALWLRRRGYAAYVFDRGAQAREQEQRELEELKRQNPDAKIPHVKTVEEQCAVLIGGFRNQDEASEVLRNNVRKLPPPTDVKVPGLLTTVNYIFTPKADGRIERAALNPFESAYLAPNPMTPQQKPTKKVDPLIKQLNDDEPMSVMKNKAPWTLIVREFTGSMSIVPENGGRTSGFLDQLPFAPHQDGPQMAQVDQASRLAQIAADWMRKAGYEAYVLHTPQASLVTVGGFDSPNDKRIEEVANRLLQDKRFEKFKFTQPMMALEVPRP